MLGQLRRAVMVVVACLSLACAQSCAPDARTATESYATYIHERFGVQVHFEYNAIAFFPPQWRLAPYSAQGTQVEWNEGERVAKAIQHFLEMYPPSLVARALRHVYVLGSMSFYGHQYGGTWRPDAIYVVREARTGGYDDGSLAATLHAEFSSVLLSNYPFPVSEWTKVNDKAWRYQGSGHEVLGQPDLLGHSEELWRQGFICRYSTASMEEDINMYVSHAISDPRSLKYAAARHDRIRRKLQLVIRFYEAVGVKTGGTREFELVTVLKGCARPD
jgi:hypothetical protein